MFGIIKNLINFCHGRAMIISYEKIGSIPKTDAGYIDVDEVVNRYRMSAKNASYKSLMNQIPVKDSVYFISENFSKRGNQLKSGKLLDVGCGNGLYSMVFENNKSYFKNLEYWGCEINDRFVNLCKSINPQKNFFVSHAQKIDKKNNEFVVVFCSGTLHYTLIGWRKALKEMTRVSKRHLILARLPIAKYNKTFFVHQKVKTLFSKENHFFIVINRNELEEEFAKINLKIVSRDYSQEEYPVKGVEEKIILGLYLLEKY